MRIVSANLNQRLGNLNARSLIERWLGAIAPDLFLAQEPFRPSQQDRPLVTGYRLVSTSNLISCWVAETHGSPKIIEHSDRWHELSLQGMSVHNVYLSPDSTGERRALLEKLADTASSRQGSYIVITGDFNLAPRPEDGQFGDQPSRFTKPTERRAFDNLLRSAQLVDATCPSSNDDLEFTFERTQRGRPSLFRCDLALISSQLTSFATVTYDHSVRAMPGAFTDHSAVIIDVSTAGIWNNVANQFTAKPGKVERASGLTPGGEEVVASDSYKTAIKRKSASQIAHKLEEQGVLKSLDVKSILDFGCGYGEDVRFYLANGFKADGYDIGPKFDRLIRGEGFYDLVTLVFVVNVLPSHEDRNAVILDAASHVRPGGYLLLAARSQSAITAVARKGKWTKFKDGWISEPKKRTFQKGISSEELAWFAGAIGFRIVDCSLRLSSEVSWLICRRPA